MVDLYANEAAGLSPGFFSFLQTCPGIPEAEKTDFPSLTEKEDEEDEKSLFFSLFPHIPTFKLSRFETGGTFPSVRFPGGEAGKGGISFLRFPEYVGLSRRAPSLSFIVP